MSQNTLDSKPLTVLNASAGSGKTHQLVLEYLTILLNEEYNRSKFKSIVAMTFTNKAALEMKSRIIRTLDGIVRFDGSDKKIENMLSDLQKALNQEIATIQKRSVAALSSILHGYEDFQVSTIDKFNLRLIRSFSRDLDLPGDFEVSLDEKVLVENVVDLLMSRLGNENEEKLTRLMTNYAKANLEDGMRWDFRGQLIEFAMILSSERNQELVNQLMELPLDEESYRELTQQFRAQTTAFLDAFKKLKEAMENTGLQPEMVTGGRHAYNGLMKVAGSTKVVKLEDTGLPFNKSALKPMDESEKKPYPLEIVEAMLPIISLYEEGYENYCVLEKYRSNFYNMALLQYIADSLKGLRESEQLIRISEFNKLISNLVKDEEAPYIYERLGTRLEHFLLDEFQDTSRLQWLNLIPLVHESISNNRKNLIVGDPKQSIYRFNNGLADQFVALPGIYNPENDSKIAQKSAYFQEHGQIKELKFNFRSAPEIVGFNNQLFKDLVEMNASTKAPMFYNSLSQEARSKETGFVRIISHKGKRPFEETMDDILKIIQKCDEDEFKRGDICILTEKNNQGSEIANALTEKGIAVVSQESLLIVNDNQVQLLLSYLKRRAYPSKIQEIKRFAELYLRQKSEGNIALYMSYFVTEQKDGKTFRRFDDDRFIADYFLSKEAFFCAYENLYDLASSFLDKMEWKETENPYLHHFMDVIFDFQSRKHSDLIYFLEYVEEKKGTMALQMPDSNEAVKIMSIHKSKGLEFEVVILPFLDLNINPLNTSKFLMKVKDKIIYSALSSKSPIADLADFSDEEKNLIFLDKLNLCYVALTRPEKRLYGFNYHRDGLGVMLHSVLGSWEKTRMEGETLIFESGEELKKEVENKDEKKKQTGYYLPQEFKNRLWYPDIVFRKVSNDLTHSTYPEVLFGVGFHALMAVCNQVADIEKQLIRLIEEGIVDSTMRDEIKHAATQFFDKLTEKGWILPETEIISEALILVEDDEAKRPDKILVNPSEIIVIDFKTGKERKQHQFQIGVYQQILTEMYGLPVSSWLYYTENEEFLFQN